VKENSKDSIYTDSIYTDSIYTDSIYTDSIYTDSIYTDFIYTYKLKRDISTVKGGIKVLRDLEYPLEIINDTIEVLKEIIV
jgi:hypothetical protein